MAELTSFQDWPWQHWASHQPNATALVTDNFSYTWQQLNQQINKLVCHFYDQGLRSQQTVALMGKNSLDLLLCQLAILRCGARILPLNPRLPDLLLSELLPHLNINFVINFSDCTGNSLNFPSLTIAKTAVNADFPLRELPSFSEFAQQPATLILTSGSTGLPKAAVHSISAHLDSANGVLQAMNYQQNDCWLLSLPLFHVSGQGILWRWLLKGGCLAVKLGSLADALNGCTHASLVPTQLWRLLNQPDESTLTLKQVLLGGAMIPTSLTDLATSRGIECWSGYGMTEMASTVCAKRADGQKGVGLPLKGKKVRLVDGEIQIQAKSQALGYWFDGTISQLKTQDGWFKTNDKGVYIDNEYQVIGRLDNLFISGGECVQPEDIEAVINSHPSVGQSFVIPIDDSEFGQRPVAVIELTEEISLASIAAWLKDKLTPYQYPAHFYQLANELKSHGIKISRRQVRHWVLNQMGAEK